jgi:hypothetical protein
LCVAAHGDADLEVLGFLQSRSQPRLIMSAPAEKQPDQTRIIAFLAKESQQPVADIAKLYEHERAKLALGAHITKFLHIFAIRNVQEILHKRAADSPGALDVARPILAV